MQLRIINAKDVHSLLPMDKCIDLMRHAMAIVSDGKAIQPIRTGVRRPEGGMMGMMPGWIGDPDWLGIKVVAIFPENFKEGIGSHQGMVLLFESKHGFPVAAMDANEITAVRTAAATAVGTDVLARKDAKVLSVFGYGEQAHTHLNALTKVRDFDELLVWGRNPEGVKAFCAKESERLGRKVEFVADVEEAARRADVLCTVTGAPEPFLKGEWLRPGQHLSIVGSSVPTTSEIDHETVKRSRFFGDFRDSTLALGGDIRRAIEAGVVGEDHVLGTIGDIITGKVEGRTSDQDITLFKSLGMVAEDLISADFVYREAEKKGVGQVVEW